ncbi:MAG: uracil-DNA glycosylase family protein [Betaproteobacteria bacterium]
MFRRRNRSEKHGLWSVVPWYVGSGTRIRAATGADLVSGIRPLPRLLALLRNLQVIVLVGKKAEKASPQLDQAKYRVLTCPHPSPMFVYNRPGKREKIATAFKGVKAVLSGNSPRGS